jgi:hypothetical protein
VCLDYPPPVLSINLWFGNEITMKRLMIYAFVIVALVASMASLLRSHSPSTDQSVGSVGMPSLKEIQTAVYINKLPSEDFEDMSLVTSSVPKR